MSEFTVIDRHVRELHGLPGEGPWRTIEPGETHKTIETWQGVLDALVEERIDRDGVLVAVGGGMTLDLAGFAAATYLRGIRWRAVPTTLLAMVDAAWGGKTGIDHPAAKNLIGAFHPPESVDVRPEFLRTLPEREMRSGLAEVVKHGVIGDRSLLDRAGRDDPASFVEDAAQVKREIVVRDPKDVGERRTLNLGHTLGHAFERASDYRLAHGEAVALGLRAACRIAERHCGFLERETVEEALDRCELPGSVKLAEEPVLEALAHDKKRSAKALRWALPLAIGDVQIFEDVPAPLVQETLRELLA
ncbi:MAG: 3-dehydroquinate synthase family protein [Planctomycetota bacterium]